MSEPEDISALANASEKLDTMGLRRGFGVRFHRATLTGEKGRNFTENLTSAGQAGALAQGAFC